MTKIEKIESQIKDLLSEVEKLKNYPKQKDTKIDGNLFTK